MSDARLANDVREGLVTGLIEQVFSRPTGGVVALVDALLCILRLWPEFRFQMSADGCFLGHKRCNVEIAGQVKRESLVRAVLARLAHLCNERTPGSVSPYGGQGDLEGIAELKSLRAYLPPNPEDLKALVRQTEPVFGVVHVEFVNTAAEQRLQLTPLSSHVALSADAPMDAPLETD